MNTIQTKYSCKRVNKFLKEGGILFDIVDDNEIVTSYYNYLTSIGNKEYTLFSKLRYIYLLEQYLVSVDITFKNFSKENIYDYFEECSKLSWSYSLQDRNKYDVKTFLNWAYKNSLTRYLVI